MAGDERIRLFCGLRLPADTLDRIDRWQSAELHGGRIVPPENLHLTLAFLGHRPACELPSVGAALREAVRLGSGISLRVHGYHETRSVGMLTFDDARGRATAVAEALQEGLGELGAYKREQRPWLPHLTVLRFSKRPKLHPELPELGEVVPSDAAVFISKLRPSGAEYVVLERVALGG